MSVYSQLFGVAPTKANALSIARCAALKWIMQKLDGRATMMPSQSTPFTIPEPVMIPVSQGPSNEEMWWLTFIETLKDTCDVDIALRVADRLLKEFNKRFRGVYTINPSEQASLGPSNPG